MQDNANKGILDAKKSSVNTVKAYDNLETTSVSAINRFCFNCGGPWKFGHMEECKAKDFICRSCSKKGHFQKMCRKAKKPFSDSKQTTGKDNKLNVAGINWTDVQGNICNNFKKSGSLRSISKNVLRLNSIGSRQKRWTNDYLIGEEIVSFKLDTGADVNCVPLSLMKKLKIKLNNQHNDLSVFDYNDNKVKIFGTAKLKCLDLNLKAERSAEFLVVHDRCEPVLGLETCERFGLVKRLDVSSIACTELKESFSDKYKDVFADLVNFPERSQLI